MRKTDFDSKIIIYRSRQIFLLFSVLAMTILFTLMLLRNSDNGYAWYILALPFSGLGLLFLAIPMTEDWQYKPWQSKPRRVEQQER